MKSWRTRRELLSYVKFTLKQYGVKPRRSLGQSFTIDPFLIRNLLEYAEVGPRDEVLEIGGGVGCLTKALALKARKVVTVEVDRRLAQALRKLAVELGNVEVVEGDFLELEGWKVDKVVSTVPYSIASPLILKLVRDFKFEKAVLTFQKEFAERLVASPGSSNYGRLTVAVSAYAEVKVLRYVSRRSFYPTPDVDSAIVEVRLREPSFKVDDDFLKLVEKLFAQRNKLALSLVRKIKPDLDVGGLEDLFGKRVRDLSLEDIHRIYARLHLGGG